MESCLFLREDGTDLHLTLTGLKNSLNNMIENQAVIIWWVVKHDVFTYLCEHDVDEYETILENMRNHWQEGRILTVHAGPTLHLEGGNLYPILVEFDGVNCPAYFMLSETGEFDLTRYVPYFFSDELRRHNFISIFTPETHGTV